MDGSASPGLRPRTKRRRSSATLVLLLSTMSVNGSATTRRRTPLRVASAPAWQIWTALLTVYLVWGSTYLGIAFVIETLPPLTAMGARFTVAGVIVLLGLSWLRGTSAFIATRAQLAVAAASGVLLLLGGNGLVAVAQQGVSSGLAALLVASVPLWVVVLRAWSGDRPALATVAGVSVGLVGTAVLLLPGGGGRTDPAYAVLVVGAAISWSCGAFLATRRPVPRDPFLLTSVQMLAGGSAMLAVGAIAGDGVGLDLGEVSRASWIALAYLIVFGSIPGVDGVRVAAAERAGLAGHDVRLRQPGRGRGAGRAAARRGGHRNGPSRRRDHRLRGCSVDPVDQLDVQCLSGRSGRRRHAGLRAGG